MADKKKVYSIVINGLQESVDMVESLNNQLKELDKTIKAVETRTIKIKGEVEVDTEKTKTVVSGGGSTGAIATVDSEKELAFQKQITNEIKAQGQYQAALDEEYRKGMQIIKDTKLETKDLLSGAIDEAGQYTNTMAGWKAELRDLKRERENLDLTNPEDVERFKEIQERANALTTILKTIEFQTGQFGRNVGNYPQMISSLNTELQNTERTIKTIEEEMASASGDRFNKLASELEIAKKRAEDLKKQIEEVGNQIQSVPKFEVKVGDTVRQFDNAKQASKELMKEYTSLVAAGKQDTQEAKNLAEAYGRVATATKNARGELQSYVGNAKALKDTVEIMQGVASIGSLGAGISGLFGGKNEELDKSLKTFTNLSLIMNGLTNLQKQINDKTSLWGVILSTIWDKLDGLAGKMRIKWIANVAEMTKSDKVAHNLGKEYEELVNTTRLQNEELAKTAQRLIEARTMAEKYKEKLNQQGSLTDDQQEFLQDSTEEIDKARAKLTELSGQGNKVAEQFLELDNQMASAFSKAYKAFGNLSTGMKNFFVNAPGWMKKTVTGINAIGIALKGLAKATVVLAAIQLAMEGIQWAIDGAVKAWNVLTGKGGLEIEQQMQMAADNTELANKQLEKYIDTMNLAKNLGLISELQAQGLAFKEIDKYIQQAGKDLQEFIKIQDDLKLSPIEQNLNTSSILGDDSDISNLKEFEKEWAILVKAVETGQDKIEAGSKKGWGWLLTSGDAVEELGDKTKAVLGDMMNEINKINFDKPEQAVKQFRQISDNELYKSALTQMHTLFPEEEWAKTLDRMYNNLSNFVDRSEKRAEDLAVAMKKANQELEDAAELSNINAIPDANKRQEALDEYNKKKRKKEIQDTVADEEHKQKALEALDKEYAQKAKDRAKERSKSMQSAGDAEYAVLKQIRDNLLELEKEGLDKEKQRLKNAMDDELRNIKKAGKHMEELETSIRKKYHKKIEDMERDWLKNQLKQREAFNKELIRMANETSDELADIMNTANLNAINRGLEENENQNIKRTATISYDTNIDTSKMSFSDNDKLLKEQKKYYDEMLKAQSDYIAKKTQLQLDESLENERQLKQQAEREYNQRLAADKEWHETQLEELNKSFKEGLVNTDEYNEKLLELTFTFENSGVDAYEVYQQKLSEATKNGEQERNNIVSEGRQEQQRINDEANQNGIAAIQSYYDEIGNISDREQKKNMNRHTGLFNYAAEKERLEKVKAGYEKVMADLETEYENLKEQYNSGDIDFNQFKEGKQQIEDLKKQAQKAAEDTDESTSDLFQNYAQSINEYASKIASQFQSMFSTFQNIQSLMLDAEQSQLDQEEKILDRQKDAVEKAYDKQAEIVEKYRDAINNTEDELKNARGERRLALLDSLAQQREAYLQETEALRKQELEKEKIARKEEQLKDKQDALEKKRKKQQQAASIINATINTALGVTQALASWPPPASYALAAAVGALGAVEIALIASQKYAKGGLLEGDSHKNGGITLGYNHKGIRQEAEGGEYIVNKQTTTENLSLIEFVNSKKRRLNLDDFIEFYSGKAKGTKRSPLNYYADGGQLGELTDYSQMINQQPLEVNVTVDSAVSVVDISNALDKLTQVKVLAGL